MLTSRDRAFDVTYGTVEQLKDISDTQARAFFEPVSPIVDPLLLQYFRADVSVTLDRKYEYLDSLQVRAPRRHPDPPRRRERTMARLTSLGNES